MKIALLLPKYKGAPILPKGQNFHPQNLRVELAGFFNINDSQHNVINPVNPYGLFSDPL